MKLFLFGQFTRNMDLRLDLMVVVIFALLYFLLLSNWFKRVRLALSLPGPKALPIIGNSLLATNSEAMLDLGNNSYEKFGPIYRVWISLIPMYVILDPKDIQNILSTNKNNDKTFFYSLMHNFVGNGLITNSGYTWRTHRKLLQPSFNINILETFIDTFCDSASSLINKLNNAVKINETMNITTFINNSVLDILNESVLGIPIKENPWDGFYENSPFRQGKVSTQDRVIKPWLLFDVFFNLTKTGKNETYQKQNLNSFISEIIKSRKQERIKGIYKRDRIYLLERMLDIQDEHPEFTDDDIVNEVCTFMLAGQESVATGVAMCLYFLAKHRDIQNKVYNELNTIFNDSKRMPNCIDLQNMKYLEQCIKETLRLCPSVPLIARKLGEDTKIGEHILPAGSDIFISPLATQRLPHIYPNPQEFDPDRFQTELIEKRNPYAFIPFSAGPRNCIGNKFAIMEMKTIISTILRNYELSVKSGYELKLTFRVTLRAKGGIWLNLKPRCNK